MRGGDKRLQKTGPPTPSIYTLNTPQGGLVPLPHHRNPLPSPLDELERSRDAGEGVEFLIFPQILPQLEPILWMGKLRLGRGFEPSQPPQLQKNKRSGMERKEEERKGGGKAEKKLVTV